uniref:Uncharacterized protein n=1 Tax=Catagonus wagneri TaxID=51154 RepID=A0A8C3X0Y1_9CETA
KGLPGPLPPLPSPRAGPAISREVQMWKVTVPKMPTNQNNSRTEGVDKRYFLCMFFI